MLIFTFNITGIKEKQSIDDSTEAMKPLMLLVLYFIDKVKRFRLTREAKNKAEKNTEAQLKNPRQTAEPQLKRRCSESKVE